MNALSERFGRLPFPRLLTGKRVTEKGGGARSAAQDTPLQRPGPLAGGEGRGAGRGGAKEGGGGEEAGREGH